MVPVRPRAPKLTPIPLEPHAKLELYPKSHTPLAPKRRSLEGDSGPMYFQQ
ncbi:MAG: hypothetical protein M3511_09480 [Deinococcota bacterium]|nr:hypothetical protein [Deinococcota bacterium]